MSEKIPVKLVVGGKVEEKEMTVEELNNYYRSPFYISYTVDENRIITGGAITIFTKVEDAKYLDFDDLKTTDRQIRGFIKDLEKFLNIEYDHNYHIIFDWSEKYGWVVKYFRYREDIDREDEIEVEILVQDGEAIYIRRGRRLKAMAKLKHAIDVIAVITGLLIAYKTCSEYRFFKTHFQVVEDP